MSYFKQGIVKSLKSLSDKKEIMLSNKKMFHKMLFCFLGLLISGSPKVYLLS